LLALPFIFLVQMVHFYPRAQTKSAQAVVGFAYTSPLPVWLDYNL